MIGTLIVLSACVLIAAGRPSAAGAPPDVAVGQDAPPITAQSWLNVPKKWSEKELAGKVVMLEFWGTWCGPCVRAMPHVQEMSDRYRDRGLIVVALSYEPPEKMQPFLEKNSFTMPVASDPAKTCVAAYGVKSWPSTFVIDREGKIAFAGGPYNVEPAIEAALGIESKPGPLLATYLDDLEAGDAEKTRATLQRLYEKAPASFDLRAWAAERLGEKVANAMEAGAGGVALLDRLAAAAVAKDQAAESSALADLAAKGEPAFDLHTWTCARYGQSWPIDAKEMADLLKSQRFLAALEAMLDRNPASAAVAAAAKSKELKTFCSQKKDEYASLARKALMIEHWLFQDRIPEDNEAFWKELATSGTSLSPDGKRIEGILLAGASVDRGEAVWYAERHQRLGLLAESLAKGKSPPLAQLPKDAAALSKKVLAELEAKY